MIERSEMCYSDKALFDYNLGAATGLIFFLNAFVLYFHLQHVQRVSFCRCFLIFNPAVFCVDDGVVLWLKIKNPTTTTTTTTTRAENKKHNASYSVVSNCGCLQPAIVFS